MQLNKHFAGGLENNQHHPTKENKPIFIVSSCFARWVLNFIVLFVELYSVTQEVGDSLNGTLRGFFHAEAFQCTSPSLYCCFCCACHVEIIKILFFTNIGSREKLGSGVPGGWMFYSVNCSTSLVVCCLVVFVVFLVFFTAVWSFQE